MIKFFKNLFFETGYKGHSEAVVISCFFNPQKSEYRTKAFNIFYNSIKHLNYRIIECVIGNDEPQLPTNDPNITVIRTKNLLWHKETLLNKIIANLPAKFKYVFWVDADVIFTNQDWLYEGVQALKNGANIIQPFEYCVHLPKDEVEPIEMKKYEEQKDIARRAYSSKTVWKSFASNCVNSGWRGQSDIYDVHGHVGFAWGAKREILDAVPMYDKALIGGSDHVMAHAAAGHIPHKCIQKSFTEDIKEVEAWSQKFYHVVRGKIDFVKGDLYHIWHGDIENRKYLQRIIEFTPKAKKITKRDSNGLYITDDVDTIDYMTQYFIAREMCDVVEDLVGAIVYNQTDDGQTSQQISNTQDQNYQQDQSAIDVMGSVAVSATVSAADTLLSNQPDNYNTPNDNFS